MATSALPPESADNPQRASVAARWVACGAHLIQDGLVAVQYVLLPLIAQAFGLTYAQVGALRAVSSTALTLLEIPSGILAERLGERRLLCVGLLGAGTGYFGVATQSGFAQIAACFFVAGAGAAFQHSLASALLVRHHHGAQRRRALGTYNAAGDAGKLTFTGAFSLAVGAGMAWNTAVLVMVAIAVAFGIAILFLLREDRIKDQDNVAVGASSPHAAGTATTHNPGRRAAGNFWARWGVSDPARFARLVWIVTLDSLVQSVVLTFIAFLLVEKGASAAAAAAGVTVVLFGGMGGKYFCGHLAVRLGDRVAFRWVQVVSAVMLTLLVVLPLTAVFLLLPVAGVFIQGSSTVTYGAVPDLVEESRQSRGYGLVYSVSGLAAVIGPVLAGVVADAAGLDAMIVVLAVLTLLTLPPSRVLSPGSRTN